LNLAMGETVFAQGDRADAIFFIESVIDYDNNGFTVRTELLTDLVLHD
jgi:hypothetical protein